MNHLFRSQPCSQDRANWLEHFIRKQLQPSPNDIQVCSNRINERISAQVKFPTTLAIGYTFLEPIIQTQALDRYVPAT